MGYPIDVKERAFQLFVQGYSELRISKELGVNRKTIHKWRKHYGWDARRAHILQEAREKQDQELVHTIARIREETERIREQVMSLINETGFRSLEGGINAYVKLSRLLVDLEQQGREPVPSELLEKIWQVLTRHPEVGPVLNRHREEILDEIAKEIQG